MDHHFPVELIRPTPPSSCGIRMAARSALSGNDCTRCSGLVPGARTGLPRRQYPASRPARGSSDLRLLDRREHTFTLRDEHKAGAPAGGSNELHCDLEGRDATILETSATRNAPYLSIILSLTGARWAPGSNAIRAFRIAPTYHSSAWKMSTPSTSGSGSAARVRQ